MRPEGGLHGRPGASAMDRARSSALLPGRTARGGGFTMIGLSLEARRLLRIQLALSALLAGALALADGSAAALAIAYGGGIALVLAWIMGLTVAHATDAARRQPGSETLVLYLGAMGRFATAVVLFALGIGLLELLPVQVIVGFAVVHGAYFLSSVIMGRSAAGTSRDSLGE